MIIANKIYQLRKKLGYSQEELAFRLNVSRQSVSKWESANSIPDIDKIIEMSKLFGVTTDYLLKNEIEDNINDIIGEEEKTKETLLDKEEYQTETLNKSLDVTETYRFLNAVKNKSKKVGLGVVLCILSVIPLIVLTTLNEEIGFLSAAICEAIGLSFMILLVTIAVVLFIINTAKMKDFAYLFQQNFIIKTTLKEELKAKQRIFRPFEIKNIAISVIIFIFSIAQLVIVGLLIHNEIVIIISLSFMFLASSLGVYLLIVTLSETYAYQLLLAEGDYTKEKKKDGKIEELVGNIFWPLALLIYLTWSFLTNDWHITWVVWVAGALLYEAIVEIIKFSKKKS